jgi:glycerol-3-phosphate dehydrogenase
MKGILGDDIDYEKELLSSWAGIRPLVRSFEEEDKPLKH